MSTIYPRLLRVSMMLSAMFLAAASWADAVAAQARTPMIGYHWTVELAPKATLDVLWIPAGTFTMGSPSHEPGRKANEGPQTEVTLSRGFWLGKNFVTIGDWKKIMGTDVREHLSQKIKDGTQHDFEGKKTTLRDFMHWSVDADPAKYLANESDEIPMYFVSWDDAKDFCSKLTQRERAALRLPEGYEFDLPTEAQWEYACRAGTITATHDGPTDETSLREIAWYAGNSAENYQGRGLGPTRSGPRAVGQKRPNAWGLHDMYGNLWQWCRDWHAAYPGGKVIDPMGPPSGSTRANRGGSFGSGPFSERSACRSANPPFEASAYRGFRVALTPLPQDPAMK